MTARVYLALWNLAVRRYRVNRGNATALRVDRFYQDAIKAIGIVPSGSIGSC